MEDRVEKLKIPDINVESLKGEDDGALLNLHRHLHGLWTLKRKGSAKVGFSLEDLWNAHDLVVKEMLRRDMVHGSPLSGMKLPKKGSHHEGEEADEPIETSVPQETTKEGLAPVKPSGNKEGRVVKLEEVLEYIKSFKLRQPLVYLTGGIVNNGQTEGDIDFQVKGDLPPGMLKIIQFRIGRMMPKELSDRINVMTDDFDGPFTNNIPLGDLMFKVNGEFKILRMAESFVPPKAVQEAAKLGLELRGKFNRGGTDVGVARARDLSNGRAISEDTIQRMVSYFARHAVDAKAKGSKSSGYWKDNDNPSAGWIAWLLWGGDPGKRWAESKLEEVKKQDLYLDYPGDPGPRKATLQLHGRGKSLHGDLRFEFGKQLIGWTMFWQKEGAVKEDVNTVKQAKEKYTGYSMEEGNKFLKPILAPEGIQAVPKKSQPEEWLEVEGVFEPGEIGATKEEEGVFAIVEEPKEFRVEWGIQKPHFHEYFLTGGDKVFGTLYLRRLSTEDYERAGDDPTFWRAFVSKDFLPSVLNKRSVKKKTMPPDGQSAMPKSLMDQTPKEFRFWEKKGDEARKVRDELVRSGFFTEDNVEYKDGEYKRIEKKAFHVRDIRKKQVPFLFQYQAWKGQVVTRVGPSKELWTFYLDTNGGGKVRAFIMENDPRKSARTTAVVESRERDFLALEGEVEPGDLGNPTKDTPSFVDKLDEGEVTVYEDSPGKIRFKAELENLEGDWTIERESKDSDLWIVYKEKKRKGIQKGSMSDEEIFPSLKADLKPIVNFDPLKPRSGYNVGVFFDIDLLIEKWAERFFKGKGKLIVNPKWNGFRTIVQKKGDGEDAEVAIWFEDEQEDRSHVMPSIVKEVKSMKGDFIIDAELIEYKSKKRDEVRNRKELVKWATSEKEMDDSLLSLKVFHILYWNKPLIREPYHEIVELIDEKISGLKHFEPTEHWMATDPKQLKEAIQKASRIPGSEGAMVKLWNSTYTLGGETSSWVKYKVPRIVDAIILDRHKVKGSKETWNFLGGVGPIPKDEKAKYTNTREHGGKTYVVIGKTFNTNLQGKVGDIITVTASEIFVEEEGDKKHIRWFIPIATGLNEADNPDSISKVEKLGLGEVPVSKDFEVTTPILKVDKEERMVYGVVLEPNTVDAQGDIVSPEEVRKACHKFMEFYKKLGYQHSKFNKKFRLMECYIAPAEFILNGQTIKEGSWVMAVRVIDDNTWKEVKEGKITGFSIGGFGKRTRRAA